MYLVLWWLFLLIVSTCDYMGGDRDVMSTRLKSLTYSMLTLVKDLRVCTAAIFCYNSTYAYILMSIYLHLLCLYLTYNCVFSQTT